MSRPVLVCGGVFELLSVFDYEPPCEAVYDSSAAAVHNSIDIITSSSSSDSNSSNHKNVTASSSSSGNTNGGKFSISIDRPRAPLAAAVYCVASTSSPVSLAREIATRIKSRYVYEYAFMDVSIYTFLHLSVCACVFVCICPNG